MVRRISLAFPILLALLAPLAVGEQADDLLAGVQRWLDGTRDLQGSFEQELLSGALGTGIEESGEWFLLRPGRLRFDYHEPETKVAVVDGHETLMWVEEDEQTVRGRLDAENDLLVALLVGETPLRELFEPAIDLEPVPRGRVRLRLTPRVLEETFTELILTVQKGDSGLEAVEVLDAAGNRMLYRFPRLRRNRGVPSEVFLFQPPDESGN